MREKGLADKGNIGLTAQPLVHVWDTPEGCNPSATVRLTVSSGLLLPSWGEKLLWGGGNYPPKCSPTEQTFPSGVGELSHNLSHGLGGSSSSAPQVAQCSEITPVVPRRHG